MYRYTAEVFNVIDAGKFTGQTYMYDSYVNISVIPDYVSMIPELGWGIICGSVIAADCGVQSAVVRAMGCCYLRCATCVIAGHYATSHCKPLLVVFM